MKIIIDGQRATLGRLASYAAKQTLKGHEVVIVNCNEVIITGKRKFIESDFAKKTSRIGHSQKGPKIIKSPERIVKRAIRGMLPEHRFGRGRVAYKNIKCYNKTPKEFEESKKISFDKTKTNKFMKLKQIIR